MAGAEPSARSRIQRCGLCPPVSTSMSLRSRALGVDSIVSSPVSKLSEPVTGVRKSGE
jgi:hypothetical protein